MSSGPDFCIIENYLNKFVGGDVIFSRDYFHKGLAVIYLNNPLKRNAITGTMMVKLRQCIEELEVWQDGKAVLLCGLGGNFCSGGDLDFARASGTQKEALYMSNWMQDTLKRLQQLPIFSVCLVQGPTLGGGAEISIFCDFIIATEDVKYGFVQGKMGILTVWGATTCLCQKIGHKQALDLLLTSEILTAENCSKRGIADFVVPVPNCFEKTMEWIDRRLHHHPFIVRSFKRIAIKALLTQPFEASLEFEKGLFSLTWGSGPNKEALAKNFKHTK